MAPNGDKSQDEEQPKEHAQVAFEAYSEEAGGKTYDDKDIPPFDKLGSKVQECWRAAIDAVTRRIIEENHKKPHGSPDKICFDNGCKCND